ncbi:MAG TPA: transcriptional repressor LexA [Phycisphaerae bacterium]|nr:transcriptional repressor LexA [Phycisphaerae bacterium]
MANLTPKQFQIVRFLQDYWVEHEYAPTMQEIADHLGVSRPTVFQHIEAMEKKNVLAREPTLARGVTLGPEYAPEGTRLPLVGRIAAGSPIEAIEDTELLDLESLFRGRPGETFALQVRGDSMIDEQIRDGDYVVVQKRQTARDGETVVAILPDGEATLKKFYKEKGRIRLQPANPTMQPIYAPNVTIQGIVIGVLRKY